MYFSIRPMSKLVDFSSTLNCPAKSVSEEVCGSMKGFNPRSRVVIGVVTSLVNVGLCGLAFEIDLVYIHLPSTLITTPSCGLMVVGGGDAEGATSFPSQRVHGKQIFFPSTSLPTCGIQFFRL